MEGLIKEDFSYVLPTTLFIAYTLSLLSKYTNRVEQKQKHKAN